MRSPAVLMLFLALPANAQEVVSPAEQPGMLHEFERRAGEQTLSCDVTPRPAAIDFAFRFKAGFNFHVPRSQYSGSAPEWSIFTAITPEKGESAYLLLSRRLADASAVGSNFEIPGEYFLGVGRYSVESTLRDDQGRVCRQRWRVVVAPSPAERAIPAALPPNAVRGYSPFTLPDASLPDHVAPMTLTILVNAAAFSTHRTLIRETDTERIGDALIALLQHLPAKSVRLVVFSLEQQKEVLRDDSFRPAQVSKVADAIAALPQSTIDASLLKNPHGHMDFLAKLIQGELEAREPADTVVFLGPTSRYSDKIALSAQGTAGDTRPRFFYVRYETFERPGIGDRPTFGSRKLAAERPRPPRPPSDPYHGQPDIIAKAVAQLNGKTMIVHTPAELSAAIRKIEIKPDNR